MSTRTRFEKETKGNSEMAYSISCPSLLCLNATAWIYLVNMKQNCLFCFELEYSFFNVLLLMHSHIHFSSLFFCKF